VSILFNGHIKKKAEVRSKIMAMYYRMEGYINDADVNEEDFNMIFTEWLESNRWGYTGRIVEIEDDEDIKGYLDKRAKMKEGIFLQFNDRSSYKPEEAE
jgi:hypothetical protein